MDEEERRSKVLAGKEAVSSDCTTKCELLYKSPNKCLLYKSAQQMSRWALLRTQIAVSSNVGRDITFLMDLVPSLLACGVLTTQKV